jgi:hypothetical protein
MAVSVRVTNTQKSITAFLNEALSPAAQSKAFANFARQELRKGQEQNKQVLGTIPSHKTFVDGRREAPLESVRPNGRIVFEFELVLDVLGWIAGQLATHSPVRTGQFLGSHALFADGVEVNPAKPPPAREYVFISLDKPGKVRSLESGHSKQAPAGVYEVVAQLARARFSNHAKVRFSYHAPYRPDLRRVTGPARRKAEKDVRVPAIIVIP